DLHENDTVYVEKGGEIIPKVTGVNMAKRPENAVVIHYPERCPECDTSLIRKEGEAIHYCPNDTGCPPQIVGRIQHFISRKAMDIEGMGDETIETFFQNGLLSRISDIYRLADVRHQLVTLERFGEKSINKMLDGIEASKNKSFEKVLF